MKNKIQEKVLTLYNGRDNYYSVGYIWKPVFKVYKSLEKDELIYLWPKWKRFLFSLIPNKISLKLPVYEYDHRQFYLYKTEGRNKYIEVLDRQGSYITKVNNKIIEKGNNMKRNLVLHTDKILTQPTESLELGENGPLGEMLEFIKNHRAKGKQIVSLSAPQIGISKRLFMLVSDEKVRAFVNPTIVELDSNSVQVKSREGCLNIPNITGDVLRHSKIRIEYFNENWEKKTEEFSNEWAFIVQHELDHLDGILFTKKATNKKFSKR